MLEIGANYVSEELKNSQAFFGEAYNNYYGNAISGIFPISHRFDVCWDKVQSYRLDNVLILPLYLLIRRNVVGLPNNFGQLLFSQQLNTSQLVLKH